MKSKLMFKQIIVLIFLFFISKVTDCQAQTDSVELNIEIELAVKADKLNECIISDHPAFLGKSAELSYYTKEELPQGFLFEESGQVSWKPDSNQFKELLESPRIISFYAQSVDDEEKLLGRLVLKGIKENVDSSLVVNKPLVKQEKKEIVKQEIRELKPLELILPQESGWNTKNEGDTFSFKLNAKGGSEVYRFELLEPQELMGNLSPDGEFIWEPGFDVVSSVESQKNVNIKVKVLDESGESLISNIPLTISNLNRSPKVGELPIFYIQYESLNKYSLKKKGIVFDPDGDSIIFKPVLKDLPQGMTINDDGEIHWRPSRSQFYSIRSKPLTLGFSIKDHPKGATSSGSLKIQVSQEDLPPQITIIPNKEEFDLKENDELDFNFFITDPNGEENIVAFDFVSGNTKITEQNLKKISSSQYEFSWSPGYQFIQEKGGKEEFKITFFAIDRESNRAEKQISVRVNDTEDLLEKDRILYDQYRTVLERSWELVQQLNAKEKELDDAYDKAKKGKRNRAIMMASLGVLTGLSPVIFLDNDNGQTILTAIGGTATATLSSLEASGIIGDSPSDIMKKLSKVSEKRNNLMIYGNVFAGKYALPLERRGGAFQNDLQNLTLRLNIEDSAELDLDPTWVNPKQATDDNIKKVYKDFNTDIRFVDGYKK